MVLVLVDAPFAPFVASVSAPSLRATPSETRVRFEENRGQWDERIRFRARASEATVLITNDAMISMPSGVTLRLADATPSAPRGERELATKSNFFIGNDATKWRTGVRNFESVRATWRPGVDIVWHGSEGHIEYDLEVAAGVDATKLALIVDDADDIAGDDTLEMLTAAGRFVQSPPRVVQAGRELHARYVREQNALRFALDGYDAAEPLLVDPVILYSTYLGGSDSNSVSDIAIDASGNAYVTGRTLSTDFPTKNPVQSTYAGAGDAFVTKLDSTGTALVYSTYLGGSDDDDGIAIAIDASGHAYVTGLAISDDFPMKNPFDSVAGGNGKPFVAQLDASGALVYSTYLGGSTDDTATDIAVDASGDAYITGTTYSSDFPTKNPIQSALKGVTNAFLTKLNASGSALVYSTFLGGSAVEIGYGVALDASNNAYVVGQTGSSDFPTVTPFQSTLRGTYDAFVTKVNAAGSALVFSTYFGGNSGGSGGYDTSSAVAVDSSGDVYFAGTTYTSDFPTKNAAQTTAAGADDGFVAVLDSTGTSLVFSTYLGGADNDEALALALDAAGKVTVVGQTASNDFPTLNPFQLVNDGNTDAFVASYDASGALLYSSFLGGSKLDTADAVALDVNGGVYVAGATISTDFPIKGAFESTTLGETAFVTKLVAELPLGIACVVLVGIRDADDAAVAGREGDGGGTVIPGRGDDDDVVCPCVIDRGLKGVREPGVREAHVDDVGAVLDGPHDALDDVAVGALAVGVEDGDRHDLDAGVADPRDALAVVRQGGDDPGHRGSVAVGVGGAIGPIEDRGPRNELTGKVRMRAVNAGVQDRDDRASTQRRTEDVVPADLRERPLIGIPAVTGVGLGGPDAVGFDPADVAVGKEVADHARAGPARR